MQQTLNTSFSTAFAHNQDLLNSVSAKLTNTLNNPQGFDPKTLALMKTNSSDTVTQQTLNAQQGANAYLATHGGSELGSGVGAQIKGGIAAAGATEDAKESSNIDIQNGLLQNQNYWQAINGLTNVANAENPTAYANAANGAANSTADLSKAYLASQQAGWQDTFGVISGIAGLATAASGLPSFGGASGGGGASAIPEGDPSICWIAQALYGDNDPRVATVRTWLMDVYQFHHRGRYFVAAYRKFGRRIAPWVKRFGFLQRIFRPVFDSFLRQAAATQRPGASIDDFESVWYQR